MVFEPYMIEPLCLTMKCGSTFSPNSSKVFDIIRISSDHLPGKLIIFFYGLYVFTLVSWMKSCGSEDG